MDVARSKRLLSTIVGDSQSRPRSCGMLRDSIITLYLRVFIYETSNLMSRGTYRDGVRSPPVWRPPDPYAVPPSGHTKPGIQSPSAGKGILPNCKSGNIYRPEKLSTRGVMGIYGSLVIDLLVAFTTKSTQSGYTA